MSTRSIQRGLLRLRGRSDRCRGLPGDQRGKGRSRNGEPWPADDEPRERLVLVEPRGAGMTLITLRAAEEVSAADFACYDGELDGEAGAIASMIIKRKLGAFAPTTF